MDVKTTKIYYMPFLTVSNRMTCFYRCCIMWLWCLYWLCCSSWCICSAYYFSLFYICVRRVFTSSVSSARYMWKQGFSYYFRVNIGKSCQGEKWVWKWGRLLWDYGVNRKSTWKIWVSHQIRRENKILEKTLFHFEEWHTLLLEISGSIFDI